MLQGDGIHFTFLKVLAAQHTDKRANKLFFKCYQVNPDMKKDGVKKLQRDAREFWVPAKQHLKNPAK